MHTCVGQISAEDKVVRQQMNTGFGWLSRLAGRSLTGGKPFMVAEWVTGYQLPVTGAQINSRLIIGKLSVLRSRKPDPGNRQPAYAALSTKMMLVALCSPDLSA
jgi:hypothetical protein